MITEKQPDGRLNPLAMAATMWAAVLVGLVIFSPAYLLYDEGAYLPGALLLADGNGLSELLAAPFWIPTGPLYAIVHAGAASFNGFAVPEIRYVNLAALAGCWLLIGYVLQVLGYERYLTRSAAVIGVPMVWVTSGMALTEMPALFFACAAVALSAWAVKRAPSGSWQLWAGFLLSGLAMGIAILGRQLILPALIGYAIVAVFEHRLRWPSMGAIVVALLVCVPVFIIWGNIVPPSPLVENVSDTLQPIHGVLALCYLGVILALLAPSYFLSNGKTVLAAAAIGGIVGLGVGAFGFEIAPGVSSRLPEALQPWFQRAATGIMCGAVGALGVATLCNLRDLSHNRVFVLSTCLMGGLALTALGVSHLFSSRYLITAFPFVMISIQPFLKTNWWAAARISAGALIGLLSLTNYYDQPALWHPCAMGGYRAFCLNQ